LLQWADDCPLEQVVEQIRLATSVEKGWPWFPLGIPIKVDPIGLERAGRSLSSPVPGPPADLHLPLKEHLNRVLEPLGLGFTVNSGYLEGCITITSKESLDLTIGDDVDPYLKFRDVLQ
jgi:hypothetical protein